MTAAVPATPEPTTDNSVFEGLFARVLKPSGAFADDLRRAGYDPAKPQIRYPSATWKAAVEIAQKHCYPGLLPAEAARQLGLRFLEGFFSTITGRMIQVVLPLIGVGGFLRRVQRYYSITRTGVRIEVIEEGERQFRLVYHDPFAVPDFVRGMLEGGTKQGSSPVEVDAPRATPDGFEIVLRW